MIGAVIGRILSGGQTGSDRAALEVAIELGIPYGGWCPAGGWAEDLPEPPGLLNRYPLLTAAPGSDPDERTARNVRDGHATLVLMRGSHDSPGTELTIRAARSLGRPLAVIDVSLPSAGGDIAAFLAGLPPGAVLNVAGPRESEAPGIESLAHGILRAALARADTPRADGRS